MAGLEFYLSGGAANSNPALSLGGVVSTSRLYSQTVAWDGAGIAGITLVDGAGNPPNLGTLAYTFATKTIAWKPYGALSPGPEISIDGITPAIITIPADSDPYTPRGSINVSVVTGSLPGVDDSDDVAVADIEGNLFDEILTAEAEAGSTIYRGAYIKNKSLKSKFITVALASGSIAGDVIRIGMEPTKGTMQTIPDENTAPIGVTLSARNRPNTDDAVLIGTDEYIGVWIERTVQPFSTIGATPSRLQIKGFTY